MARAKRSDEPIVTKIRQRRATRKAAVRTAQPAAAKVGNVVLRVPVDAALVQELDKLLSGRGISLADAVGLYLRSQVNSFDRGRALKLSSTMPFGKYRGELVETIARADPSYFRFLLSGERPVMLEAEVQALLT